MPTRISPLPLVLTMMLLTSAAACSSSDRARATDTAATAAASSSAAGDSTHAMSGGPEAMGGMQQDTVAPKVQAHLQRLAAAAPDSLRALVSVDREVVTALIADCAQMMRAMTMQPPRKWRDAVRDLRQDLDRMASMTAVQLQQAMPAHRQRIEGMLAMRHDMMKM